MEKTDQADQVDAAQPSLAEVSSPALPAPEGTRQWITNRYGQIRFASHSVMYGAPGACLVRVVTAAVPLYKGNVAVGVGANEEYAVMALYRDLRGHPPQPLI